MNEWIDWFQRVLDVSIRLYFRQECDLSSVYDIALPKAGPLWKALLPEQVDPTFDEWMVLMLALMPHLSPQVLDIFFVHNKNFDRPYTEFGGWKGLSHGGFLPTGETAVFLLAGDRVERRLEVVRLFREEHWFHMYHVVGLEGAGNGEPFLSGQLRISEDFLYRLSFEGEYKPDYNMGFPAKRISTALNWEDAVLPYYVREELEEINNWITGHRVILSDWGLSRFLKAGYRTLFYGPPGTGKTLCATLIGKKNGMDVYRIDLSMIVSKYIGETENNLAKIRPVSTMVKDGLDARGIIAELLQGFDKVDYLTTTDLAFKCQCSKERIEDVLISLNEHDLKSLVDDGHAEVCCHFCGEKYQFNKDELTAIYNVSQKLKDNKANN